jgi:hypothetical protein
MADRLTDCEEDRVLRPVLIGMLRGGRAVGSFLEGNEKAPHGVVST